MDYLALRRIGQYSHRRFDLTLHPTILRIRLFWTLLRLTFWTANWPFYSAVSCSVFVFQMYTPHLAEIYATSRNTEVNFYRILRDLLLLDEKINRGRVFVAVLMITCWHIHLKINRSESLLKFVDNACVKARGKRASELILQHQAA
jgi:hypothetical protein